MIHTDRLASITISDQRFLRERDQQVEATARGQQYMQTRPRLGETSEEAEERFYLPPQQPSFLHFQFVDYETGIDDEISPVYEDFVPIGRRNPFTVFGGGKNRVIRFTARFMDEEFPGEALQKARFLQSLMLPWRKTATEPYLREYYPPPKIHLFVAYAEVSIEGYVTSCRMTYSAPLTYHSPGIHISPFSYLRQGRPRFVPGNVLASVTVTSDELSYDYLGESFAWGAH